jgi:hypothetical protein
VTTWRAAVSFNVLFGVLLLNQQRQHDEYGNGDADHNSEGDEKS